MVVFYHKDLGNYVLIVHMIIVLYSRPLCCLWVKSKIYVSSYCCVFGQKTVGDICFSVLVMDVL